MRELSDEYLSALEECDKLFIDKSINLNNWLLIQVELIESYYSEFIKEFKEEKNETVELCLSLYRDYICNNLNESFINYIGTLIKRKISKVYDEIMLHGDDPKLWRELNCLSLLSVLFDEHKSYDTLYQLSRRCTFYRATIKCGINCQDRECFKNQRYLEERKHIKIFNKYLKIGPSNDEPDWDFKKLYTKNGYLAKHSGGLIIESSYAVDEEKLKLFD